MTREEAIYRLKNMAWLYGSAEREQNIEAIDMAIEALSAPQTDLISRADAMGAVQDHFNADGFKGYDDGQKMMDRLKALPSADAIHSGGVFVPNMEMPKVCDYCLFHDSEWSWCKAKNKYCGDGKCPLIAVRGERREP